MQKKKHIRNRTVTKKAEDSKKTTELVENRKILL